MKCGEAIEGLLLLALVRICLGCEPAIEATQVSVDASTPAAYPEAATQPASDIESTAMDAGRASTSDAVGTAITPGAAASDPDAASADSVVNDGSVALSANRDAKSQATPPLEAGVETLFWLDILGDSVVRASGDGFTEQRVVLSGNGVQVPDGVAVDVQAGMLYWTNMGSLLGFGGGTLQRARLDGSQVETLVPPNVTQTPKQLQLDPAGGHIYWCDREGAKVWRAKLDGSEPQPLVTGPRFGQLVGIALDVPDGKLYFSDRERRRILRAGLDLPAGEDSANRSDVEELLVFGEDAMPIDLELDSTQRLLYWTDRALGTVNRAGMDLPKGETPATRSDAQVLVRGLFLPIGLSLDVQRDALYFTEASGGVWQAHLDGSGATLLASSLSAAGIVHARLPN